MGGRCEADKRKRRFGRITGKRKEGDKTPDKEKMRFGDGGHKACTCEG